MKLELIENCGPDNLRDVLKSIVPKASDVSIAVAFVTQAGLEGIIQPLTDAAARGRIRLLTGLYQKVTQPKALETLLRVQGQTLGRFSAKLSRDPLFHRKLYVARGKTNAVAIVGSSNLTHEGLRSGGELNVMATLPDGSRFIVGLARAFDDAWKHQAVELTKDRIIKYQRARPKPPKAENYTEGQLADILGADPTHQQASRDESEQTFWRDFVDGAARDRTHQIISEKTDWDDKNYDWMSTGGSHKFKLGHRILLFDFVDRRLQLMEVRGIARTSVPTPDGRHFVAYSPVPRLKLRRFSKTLWKALEAEKINSEKAKIRRELSPAKAGRLVAALKRR